MGLQVAASRPYGTVGNILMCSAFTAWQLWRRVGGNRQSALLRAYQPWKGGTAQRSDRAGPLGSSGRRTIFDVTRLPAVVKAMGTQLKGGVGQVVDAATADVIAIVAIPTDDVASR